MPADYLRGILMGTADVIPGVSGGTVALILGFYERLILSIRACASAPLTLVREGPRAAWKTLAGADWSFVIPLGLGVVTALVTGARVIPDLLLRFPEESRALFFGLITGSLVVPWRRIARPGRVHAGMLAAAAIAAFLVVGLPPREILQPALPLVFLTAAVAICAMILPGVSGSFLLLVMGVYEATLRALNAREAAFIAVFMLGAAVGLGLFSKLLGYLLERHHDLTMAVLVGLMVGSLRALWPYMDADRGLLAPPADPSVLVVIALILAGYCVVAVLLRAATTLSARADTAKEPA